MTDPTPGLCHDSSKAPLALRRSTQLGTSQAELSAANDQLDALLLRGRYVPTPGPTDGCHSYQAATRDNLPRTTEQLAELDQSQVRNSEGKITIIAMIYNINGKSNNTIKITTIVLKGGIVII